MTLNPIVAENQKPGTPQSTWAIHGSIDNQGDSQIEGFATQISVNAGQAVDFKIETASLAGTLSISTDWAVMAAMAPASSRACITRAG